MNRMVWSVLFTGCVVAGLTVPGEVRGQRGQFAGVELSVSNEKAPPGGMAQVKVFVTEPKPITSGGGSFTFDAYESIEGIALMNELEDVTGAAVVNGSQLTIRLASPSGTFGMDPDYPVLAVTGRIPADAPIGLKYRLEFDQGSLQLFDPLGGLYTVLTKSGHLITQSGLSIDDINPGGAVVPAGGVVTITGNSFVKGTEIKFKEAKLSQVRYISPTRIDVVVARETRMHGMGIKAANPDGSRATYFSYQRTYAMTQSDNPATPSADPVLSRTVPLVQPNMTTPASIPFPAPNENFTYGIALQNTGAAGSHVSSQLIDAGGVEVAIADIDVPPGRFTVLLLSELFNGATCAAECTVKITSATVPVQVLGIAADQVSGAAWPIAPIVSR